MNIDVYKQFHSFTNTKPIQMMSKKERKKSVYYSVRKKNQNKIFMYCWRPTKKHTDTLEQTHSVTGLMQNMCVQ